MQDLSNTFTIDFETTGVDPKECHPVEVALFNPAISDISTLIKPPIEIPPEASAIHHIIESDVANAPPWQEVKRDLANFLATPVGKPTPILVAHNADYERTILSNFVPVLWVCTYKCSLRIWPQAPAHKNEVLRYWLCLGDDRGRAGDQRPHSALHDCKVTWRILTELLKHATILELLQWSEQPAKLPYVPFGKHFKQPWSDVPYGYLKWMIGQTDMSEDVLFCANEEIHRRYP